jgi:hypothetical protein
VRNQGQSIQELQRFKNQYSTKLSTIFGTAQGIGNNNSFNNLLNNNNNDSKQLADEANAFIDELYKEDPLFTNDNRPLSPRRITPRVGRSPNFPKK